MRLLLQPGGSQWGAPAPPAVESSDPTPATAHRFGTLITGPRTSSASRGRAVTPSPSAAPLHPCALPLFPRFLLICLLAYLQVRVSPRPSAWVKAVLRGCASFAPSKHPTHPCGLESPSQLLRLRRYPPAGRRIHRRRSVRATSSPSTLYMATSIFNTTFLSVSVFLTHEWI